MLFLRSLDEKSLRHLNEFIRDISERSHFVQILQQYDFSLGIKAAIMVCYRGNFRSF